MLITFSFKVIPCVIGVIQLEGFEEEDISKAGSNFAGRKQRTMSCPARVTTSGERSRQGSKSNFSALTAELRRGFVSTIKTLALMFIYLLMSLPLQITTLLHGNCLQKSKNITNDITTEDPKNEAEIVSSVARTIPDPINFLDPSEPKGVPGSCNAFFNSYFSIFFNIFIFFLAIYPYVWLLLDKRFARKTCGICSNMIRSRDQSMIH